MTMAPEESNKTTTTTKVTGFELCDVCNLNHNQGRRHRYLASHRRALSAVLSRFQSKLADLRFFLRHPAPLRPEHSALNRLWCVFCALDLRELGSPFACTNAINHLASVEHLKNLKDFLWKHGGGMDRIDSFRVSEADFLKWEKGCGLLKNAASLSSEGAIGPQPGPSKDIQNELSSNLADSFQKNSTSPFSSSVSNAVMPLQSLTYKDYRVCESDISGSASTFSSPYVATSCQDVHPFGATALNLTVDQPKSTGNNGKGFVGSSLSNGAQDQRTGSGGKCTHVLQSFTQISSPSEGHPANVHTGALPPWLETTNENERNLLNKGPFMGNHASPLAQTGKSRKLNPKRVGAAWAEKRRVELEMEKRGELAANRSCDSDWLPNFGRVWQAGTRKESRKEFEQERRKLVKDEEQSEISLKIQPYISKRMRMNSPKNDGAVNGLFEEFNNTSQPWERT